MESGGRETENSAERMLRSVEAIRASATPMPRGHALLQLAYTVLLAAYMGVFVYTGSAEGGASVFGGTTMALVLPPIIVSAGLVNGANERFRTRLRNSARQWISLGFFFAVLAVLLIWGIAGGGYPWWISLIAVAVTLVIFGTRALGIVLRAPRSVDDAPQLTQPLPVPARLTTILLGVYLGTVCAVVFVPTAVWFLTTFGMLAVIIALSAHTTSWGLLRTGYDWRLPQWMAFGIAAVVMLALPVLIIAADIVTPAVAVGAGVLIAVCLIVAAFIPGRSRGTSPA